MAVKGWLSKALTGLAVCVALALAAVVAMCLIDSAAIEGMAIASAKAQHIQTAQRLLSPDRTLKPPVDLDTARDGVTDSHAEWQSVNLPDQRVQLSESGKFLKRGPAAPVVLQVYWYRVTIPAAAMGPDGGLPDLYIPRLCINGSAAVYLDGHRIWSRPVRYVFQPYADATLIHLDNTAYPQARGGARQIYLRVAARPENGGIVSSLWLAPPGQLVGAYFLRNFLQTGIVWIIWAGYWVLGALSFAIWRRRRHTREGAIYVWFAAMAALIPTQLLGSLSGSLTEVPEPLLIWLADVGIFLVPVCVVHFYAAALNRRQPFLERLAWISGLLCAAIDSAYVVAYGDTLPVAELSDRLVGLLIWPVTFQTFYAIRAAIKFRTRLTIVLGVLAVVALAAISHDVAVVTGKRYAEDVYLLPYCFPISMVIYAVFLFRSYVDAIEAAERSTDRLHAALLAKEAELAESHQQLMATQREQTLTQERQRLMQEMHDGIGASLVSALRFMQHSGKDTAVVTQVLEECIDDLKLSIDSLEPTEQDLLLLLSSMRFRLDPRLKGSGITLHWQVADIPALSWLDARCNMHILRILQEILTNILKHSGATSLHITTAPAAWSGAAGVEIRIEDNGCPFILPPLDAIPSARKGLGNILSRTSYLRGQSRWQATEEGNCFTLWLPLDNTLVSA